MQREVVVAITEVFHWSCENGDDGDEILGTKP